MHIFLENWQATLALLCLVCAIALVALLGWRNSRDIVATGRSVLALRPILEYFERALTALGDQVRELQERMEGADPYQGGLNGAMSPERPGSGTVVSVGLPLPTPEQERAWIAEQERLRAEAASAPKPPPSLHMLLMREVPITLGSVEAWWGSVSVHHRAQMIAMADEILQKKVGGEAKVSAHSEPLVPLMVLALAASTPATKRDVEPAVVLISEISPTAAAWVRKAWYG